MIYIEFQLSPAFNILLSAQKNKGNTFVTFAIEGTFISFPFNEAPENSSTQVSYQNQ
jgi:hypothetical protein